MSTAPSLFTGAPVLRRPYAVGEDHNTSATVGTGVATRALRRTYAVSEDHNRLFKLMEEAGEGCAGRTRSARITTSR